MILCNDLHKQFGDVEAVKGVSMEIPDGMFLGLLGPNGAGKTTLMRIDVYKRQVLWDTAQRQSPTRYMQKCRICLQRQVISCLLYTSHDEHSVEESLF